MDLIHGRDKSERHVYQNRLDQEFSQILSQIKPYISYINNPFYLNQCCVWLKKLSYTHTSEKVRRNQYLIQLADQIQNGVLKGPFNRPPPPGLLEPLPKTQQLFKEQRISPTNWNYENNCSKSQLNEPTCYQTHEITETRNDERSKRNLRRKKLKKRHNQNDLLERSWSQKNHEIKSIETKLLKLPRSDHSSWCDLTDDENLTQSTALASGDREKTTITLFKQDNNNYGNKLKSSHELEGFKQFDHFNQQYKEQLQSDGVVTASKITVNSMSASNEVEALKYRLQDLVEVKNALQTTYYTTEDWVFTINSLKKELNYYKMENSKLEKIIEMNQLEIKNINKHLQNEKNYYENIINKNNLKFEELLKEKNEGIREFHKKINDYESRFNIEEDNRRKQETNNEEQVHCLKKCISKMNKMFHKSEKEHLRQVDEMRQEIDRLQMKLKTQKAELLTNLAATKHTEFDSAVSQLEIKYKKILEKHQSHLSLN